MFSTVLVDRLMPLRTKAFYFVAILLVISLLLLILSALRQTKQPARSVLLPGQQIWKNGVSSYLFGTNDTAEWVSNNIETSASIQQALKTAGFTLMRTFFTETYYGYLPRHQTTDAEIEQRLKTIENSNMTCLGVLLSTNSLAFNMHVVSYAGNRCNIYEFGNEPDKNGSSFSAYQQEWNRIVPQLRQINPHAKFLGPVVANYKLIQSFLMSVKASGVLPDGITFHFYPCWDSDSSSTCLSKAPQFAQVTTEVKEWVRDTLNRDLPVGITEWNFNSSNPPPPYSSDPGFMSHFTTAALNAMIQSHLDFANQFDAGSGAGFGELDMFDVFGNNSLPKTQYYAIKNLINQYKIASTLQPH